MGAAAVSARQATIDTAGDDTVWWSRFGDPMLTGLVTQALGQNLDVAHVTQAPRGAA